MSCLAYVRPRSIREAVRLLAAPGARAHAGGTDGLDCLRRGIDAATTLVSLSGLRELEGVSVRPDGSLRIGARATLQDVAAHPEIRSRWTAAADAAAVRGGPGQRATVGGDLCRRPLCRYFRGNFDCFRKGGACCYAVSGANQRHAVFGGGPCYMVHPSDLAAAFMGFEGQVRIAGPDGARVLPIDSFFLQPAEDVRRENVLRRGEIVLDVILPPPSPGTRSRYRSARERSAEPSVVGAAVVIEKPGVLIERARIVLSGAAPIPWRARYAEAALFGKRISPATAADVAAAATRGAEPLDLNAYKVDLIHDVVQALLLAL